MELLEGAFDDAIAVLALPLAFRPRLRTTNGVERLNEEIRPRERVVRIFPNVATAGRLLGAVRKRSMKPGPPATATSICRATGPGAPAPPTPQPAWEVSWCPPPPDPRRPPEAIPPLSWT
jgi:hypothetical protein